MSTLLHRIGTAAFGNPGKVLLAWLVLLIALGGALAVNPPKISSEMKIHGTPAQELIDELSVVLPEAAGGQGQIVFRSSNGDIAEPEVSAAVAQAVDTIYDHPEVVDPREALAEAQAQAQAAQEAALAQAAEEGPEALAAAQEQMEAQAAAAQDPTQPLPVMVDEQPVIGTALSQDGRTAIFQFQFTVQIQELSAETIDEVVELAAEPVEEFDVEALPGSSLAPMPDVVGVGEVVGLVVAAIVLVITLGSLTAAGLPLVTALVGVATGVMGAFALSFLFQLNSLSVVLALMLGLAVGIDYALFIVNRQRSLILADRLSAREAAARAVGTAGSAVFFAGTTVGIALTALTIVGIGLLSTMALIAAATVTIAVLVALTLLPALLGLVGERIVSQKATARYDDTATESHRAANAWSRLVVRHKVLAALGVVVVAGVMAVPMTDMELGLPSGESYSSGSGQRESYDAVTEAFGEGLNGPLLVVAKSASGDPIEQEALGGLVAEIADADDVASATAAGGNEDGTVVVLSVVPTEGPTDASTSDVVHELRDASDRFAETYGATVGVTGATAMGIDISEKMAGVLPVYLVIVIGLSLIVLTLVFRSIIVPIKATLGFLLSILATFGVTTALFQWGWLQGLFGLDSTGPLLALLPVLVTGILYGLAMDYQVFLVSSMRESYVHGRRGSDPVVHGFAASSRVVVAAAVIMVSVFAGFIFNGDPMVKQIGFALAVGILIDAFLIRMTLVPAVMAMFGDRAWWLPRWLDKLLPDLDIEGDKLLKKLDADAGREPVSA